MIEHLDYWELPLKGRSVTRCLIDFSFRFELDQARKVVSIHNSFSFRNANGIYNLLPEVQTSLCPVLSIFDKSVVDAKAYKHGNLEILFSNGSHLLVAPDPNYEAWEIGELHGFLVVCCPGGELSIWLDRKKE
jgi:hypothetical protein